MTELIKRNLAKLKVIGKEGGRHMKMRGHYETFKLIKTMTLTEQGV